MSKLYKQIGMIVVICLFSWQSARAALILPDPVYPYAVQYDDFYSYSNALLSNKNGFDLPEWKINAGTGGVDILLFTGSNGVSNPAGLPDGTYDHINPSWDLSWSTKVTTLNNYMQSKWNTSIPVFMFDFNQEGGASSLYVKGSVVITDTQNNTLATWILADGTNYVYVPGELPPITGTKAIDTNVGGGFSDFMVYSPTMDLSLSQYAGATITFFLSERGGNDGAEEVFLTGAVQPASVPEPGTLILIGIGAGTMAFFRRRKLG